MSQENLKVLGIRSCLNSFVTSEHVGVAKPQNILLLTIKDECLITSTHEFRDVSNF